MTLSGHKWTLLRAPSLTKNHEPVRTSDENQEQSQGQGKLNILRAQRGTGDMAQDEHNGQDDHGNGPRYYHRSEHDCSDYSRPRLRPAVGPIGGTPGWCPDASYGGTLRTVFSCSASTVRMSRRGRKVPIASRRRPVPLRTVRIYEAPRAVP
jgi:hypothetical protein